MNLVNDYPFSPRSLEKEYSSICSIYYFDVPDMVNDKYKKIVHQRNSMNRTYFIEKNRLHKVITKDDYDNKI